MLQIADLHHRFDGVEALAAIRLGSARTGGATRREQES
jgi:hypothetical protein